MVDESVFGAQREKLPPRNPKGRKWSVMAGLTPPPPPQGVPGYEGSSDISDVGNYFIDDKSFNEKDTTAQADAK